MEPNRQLASRSQSPSGNTNVAAERTEVLHGVENVTNAAVHFFANASTVDSCASAIATTLIVQVEQYRKIYSDYKESGKKMRFVTEITRGNLADSKELMKYAEVRHLDGVRGNFSASDKEYLGASSVNEIDLLPQIIYSNSKEMVQQHQYLFKTLWEKAVPVEYRIKEIEEGVTPERTEFAYDVEKATSLIFQFYANVKNNMDVYVDKNWFSRVTEVELYNKEFHKMKERGVKFRFITEITSENISYIKKGMEWADEIRHLDGAKGNFAINETECIVATEVFVGTKPVTQVLFSNIRTMVGQQRYVFDVLWDNSILAEHKIREIEEGIEPERTEVLYGVEATTDAGTRWNSRVKVSSDSVVDPAAPSILIEVEALKNSYLDMRERGVKIRWITEITENNVKYCKEAMKFIELRHLDGIKGNFGVSESEYIAAATLYETKPIPILIISNVKAIWEQQQYVFDTLWNRAIPAEQKVKEIEEGAEPEFFDVIYDSNKANDLLLSLAKSAKKEVLLLLTNDRSLVRMDRLGLVDEFQRAAMQARSVRIICPITDVNSHVIERLGPESRIEFSKGSESQFGVMMVDSSCFIGFEMINPGAEEFSKAIGITIHSNSRRIISMLRSFFESLWRQMQLYEQLENANRKLQEHDMMQKEFVNVASHELRTPITPILVSLFLGKRVKNDDGTLQVVLTGEQAEMIERNAKRLERLATEILEVARIESRGMNLQKERTDLNQRVAEAGADAKSFVPADKKIEIAVELAGEPMVGEVDRIRLSQVLSNLIKNAIKFTDDQGKITIAIKKDRQDAVVSISDTGKGIDPEMMPRLFQKFAASNSLGGTGLGLYISKAIVEAHGGKIWAQNKKDGKGATFAFTLPLAES